MPPVLWLDQYVWGIKPLVGKRYLTTVSPRAICLPSNWRRTGKSSLTHSAVVTAKIKAVSLISLSRWLQSYAHGQHAQGLQDQWKVPFHCMLNPGNWLAINGSKKLLNYTPSRIRQPSQHQEDTASTAVYHVKGRRMGLTTAPWRKCSPTVPIRHPCGRRTLQDLINWGLKVC